MKNNPLDTTPKLAAVCGSTRAGISAFNLGFVSCFYCTLQFSLNRNVLMQGVLHGIGAAIGEQREMIPVLYQMLVWSNEISKQDVDTLSSFHIGVGLSCAYSSLQRFRNSRPEGEVRVS